MNRSNLSRRQFLDKAGQAALTVATCKWLTGVVGAVTNPAPDVCLCAICGIYCGACPLLMSTLKATKSSDKKCLGCSSPRKPSPYAPKCEVRKCARSKKLESCGLCASYPCAKLKVFFTDKPKYGLREKNLNQIRAQGVAAWLEEQKKRWVCQKCQTPFGYGVTTCSKCGEKIFSDAEEFEAFKKSKTEKA